MATILQFRVVSGDRQAKPRRRRTSGAEIVIFPGVRYERWSKPEKKSERKTGEASVRDILKIVD